jgi:uncharacterized membrane protein YidH (DUF202 family)
MAGKIARAQPLREGAGRAKRVLIWGLLLIILGVLFYIAPHIHFFRLPGDILIKRENFVLSVPVTTAIVISIIVTIILNIVFKK